MLHKVAEGGKFVGDIGEKFFVLPLEVYGLYHPCEVVLEEGERPVDEVAEVVEKLAVVLQLEVLP